MAQILGLPTAGLTDFRRSQLGDVVELGDGRFHSSTLRPGRHAWLQVVRGDVTVNGAALHGGDAAAISAEESVNVSGALGSEVLLFDLA